MKKTIAVAMALACSVAFADLSFDDAKGILSSAPTVEDTFTFSSNKTAFTVVAVVDLDTYATLRPDFSSTNRPAILTLTDSGNNAMGAKFGDTSKMFNCLFGTHLNGNDRGVWATINNVGIQGASEDNLYIGNAKAMAVTLSFSAPNSAVEGMQGTTVTFTYLSNDGDIVASSAYDGGLRYAANKLKDFTVNNTDLFSTVYMIEGTKYMGDDLKTLATVAIVPEPATATLSLLALAGLAARRRRH